MLGRARHWRLLEGEERDGTRRCRTRRLGTSRGRARCAGHPERRRDRGLLLRPVCVRAADRHSFYIHAFTIHISFDSCISLSTLAFLHTCPVACSARNSQVRTLAPAYRSPLAPEPGEARISQGLLARVHSSKLQLHICMCV